MGFLKLLPKSLQQRLLLNGILAAVSQVEAQHFGQQLNRYADARWGTALSDPIQKRVAVWLREVAKELDT